MCFLLLLLLFFFFFFVILFYYYYYFVVFVVVIVVVVCLFVWAGRLFVFVNTSSQICCVYRGRIDTFGSGFS